MVRPLLFLIFVSMFWQILTGCQLSLTSVSRFCAAQLEGNNRLESWRYLRHSCAPQTKHNQSVHLMYWQRGHMSIYFISPVFAAVKVRVSCSNRCNQRQHDKPYTCHSCPNEWPQPSITLPRVLLVKNIKPDVQFQ